MSKSPDAFRTISEVADWLGIQAHVLRFWESKFTQVKPIKRAGGRRYYRPNDMLLLGGIKKLLHDDGLTIKGVQKILREEGMNHVASLSMPLDEMTDLPLEDTVAPPAPMIEDAEPETGVVLPFDGAAEPEEDVSIEPEPAEIVAEEPVAPEMADVVEEPPAEPDMPEPERAAAEPEAAAEAAEEELPLFEETLSEPPEPEPDLPQLDAQAEPDPVEEMPIDRDPEPLRSAEAEPAAQPEAPSAPAADDMEPLPAFLRHPVAEDTAADDTDEQAPTDNLPPEPDAPEPEPEPVAAEPEAPRARDIGMPEVTPEHEIHAEPGALARSLLAARPSGERAAAMRPLLAQLAALRDSMQAQRSRSGGKD